MRSSSVIITLSLLATAAPSLALRSGSPYARDETSAHPDHETQALSWNSVKGFFKGAGEVIESATPFIQAAAPHLKGREFSDDLYARGFWRDFGHGFVKGFTGTAKVVGPVAAAFLKREDIERIGQNIANAHPGNHEAQALSWNSVKGFFKGAGEVIESATPFIQAAAPHLRGRDISNALYARAIHELRDDLVERGFWKDFGHGFVKGFTGTTKVLAPVVTAFLKREDIEMLARELESRELEARSMYEDELYARSYYDLDELD